MSSEGLVNELEPTISSQKIIMAQQLEQIQTLKFQLKEQTKENIQFKEEIIELKKEFQMNNQNLVNKLEHTLSYKEKILTQQLDQISNFKFQVEELTRDNSQLKETIIELKKIYENSAAAYKLCLEDLEKMNKVQQIQQEKFVQLTNQYLELEQIQKTKNEKIFKLMQNKAKFQHQIHELKSQISVRDNQLQAEKKKFLEISQKFQQFQKNYDKINLAFNKNQQQIATLQQFQFDNQVKKEEPLADIVQLQKEYESPESTIYEMKQNFTNTLNSMENKLKEYQFEKIEKEQQYRAEFIKNSYVQFEKIEEITNENDDLQQSIQKLTHQLNQEKQYTQHYKEEDSLVRSFLQKLDFNELINNKNENEQIREQNLQIMLVKERRRNIELKQLLNNLQSNLNKKSNELQTKSESFDKTVFEFVSIQDQISDILSRLKSYNEINENNLQLTKEQDVLVSSCKSMGNQIKYLIFIIEEFKQGKQWEQIINQVNQMKGEVDFENGKIIQKEEKNEDIIKFQEISKILEENQKLKKIVNTLYLQGMKGL